MGQPQRISLFVTAKDGVVETNYIHTDAVDITKFGTKTAPRVSDVEFDEQDQKWVARLRDGREIARDEHRDVVIDREREVIEEMMRKGEPIPGFNAPIPAIAGGGLIDGEFSDKHLGQDARS